MRILLIALLALGLAAPPARAAVTTSPPVSLGPSNDAVFPRLAIGPQGDAAVGWTTGEAVWVARRRAGGAFTPGVRLGAAERVWPALSVGDRGDVAAVWLEPHGQSPVDHRMVFARAPAGEPFSAPERVPVEPTPEGGVLSSAQIVQLADGSHVISIQEVNTRNNTSRLFVLERAAGGGYGPVLTLAEPVGRMADFVLAGGRLMAFWSAPVPGGNLRERRLWMSEREGPGRWSAPAAFSTPGRDADNGFPWSVVGNTRGDLLAVWSSLVPPDHFFPSFPDAVEYAQRPAGGDWQAPARIAEEGASMPSAAMNAAGDAVIAYNGVATELSVLTTPFGAPQESPIGKGAEVQAMPIALDDAGRAVLVRRDGDGRELELRLYGRERGGGCFMPHATVSAGKPVTAPVLAGRPDGTGLVAWNDHSTVRVAEYHWDARRAGPKCIDEGTLDGPPLAVGAIPARIRRSALRGRGLRVALRTGKPANLVTVTLLGRSRGVLRALAQRRLRDVNGKRVVRLRVPARALRRVGRELTLTVHGRSGRGETIERRRLRLLD